MTTKERLLELFETNKGTYLSGEEIARRLNVSRAAVWKAVKTLQGDGYAIDAVTNKGYCLSTENDILSAQGIRKYLDAACETLEICVLQSVDSTNSEVRRRAEGGLADGYVAIALEQTGGKGRYGREFFSPSDTGLYLSILLRPQGYSAEEAVRITTMAAVAMCEAIEEISDVRPGIKWVNDIYVRGKKVCGILTEASFGLESGLLEYAVLGVGVNIYPPTEGFPEELAEVAGAVFEEDREDVKNRLAAAFLNHFQVYYRAGDPGAYIAKYRDYSLAVGREVTVILGNQSRSAYVCGIDDACRLQVRYEDGTAEDLSYGEIRIKL